MGSIGFFFRHMMGFFGDLFLLTFTVTLWTPTYLFSRKLLLLVNSTETSGIENDHDYEKVLFLMERWMMVQQYYLALKKITKLIDKVAGSVNTCFLLEVILFYSTSFDEVFAERGGKHLCWNKVVRMAFFVCSTCAILLFSANICDQVWVIKNDFNSKYEVWWK